MSDLPIGTVTFLFTDIEGSTHLLQQLGYQYVTILTESRRLMRTAFQQFHGHEMDTQGDSFFVAFPCACDAVSAAVMAQRLLFAYAWPQDVMVRVRMGIHTGEPLLLAEGYIGLDVHCAARIRRYRCGRPPAGTRSSPFTGTRDGSKQSPGLPMECVWPQRGRINWYRCGNREEIIPC